MEFELRKSLQKGCVTFWGVYGLFINSVKGQNFYEGSHAVQKRRTKLFLKARKWIFPELVPSNMAGGLPSLMYYS